jgi:hypothetical protein
MRGKSGRRANCLMPEFRDAPIDERACADQAAAFTRLRLRLGRRPSRARAASPRYPRSRPSRRTRSASPAAHRGRRRCPAPRLRPPAAWPPPWRNAAPSVMRSSVNFRQTEVFDRVAGSRRGCRSSRVIARSRRPPAHWRRPRDQPAGKPADGLRPVERQR